MDTAEDRSSDYALGVPRQPIRRCTVADIPWLREKIVANFADQTQIDMARVDAYWNATINRDDHFYVRGAHSVGCSRLVRPYWASLQARPYATDLFFLADKGVTGGVFETVAIMRKMIEWAKSCGCDRYVFMALNGTDISVMAKRVGATQSLTAHIVNFLEKGT